MRTHRLLGAAVATAAAAGLLAAAPASAATVSLTGGTLSISIAALPTLSTAANPGSTPLLVSSGSGSFTEPPGVFGPTTVVWLPTIYTIASGIPQISGLTLLSFGNGTKTVDCGGAHCTGTGGLQGQAILNVLGLLNLTIPLGVVGQAGASAQASGGSIVITVVGQGWTTGTAVVTALTTTTPGTAVLNTVTRMGSDARAADHTGQITLVSGFQSLTNVAGTLPGFATQTLRFQALPEPGALLLLGAGALALAALGARRMR